MTILRHKQPCKECPFGRASAPGYLGSSHTDEFLYATIHGDEHMPCHMAIDYEKENWQENQLEKASHCAGSLIFMKNQCKSPRDAELRNRVNSVNKDTKKVFQWPQEFRDHHNRVNIKKAK